MPQTYTSQKAQDFLQQSHKVSSKTLLVHHQQQEPQYSPKQTLPSFISSEFFKTYSCPTKPFYQTFHTLGQTLPFSHVTLNQQPLSMLIAS